MQVYIILYIILYIYIYITINNVWVECSALTFKGFRTLANAGLKISTILFLF